MSTTPANSPSTAGAQEAHRLTVTTSLTVGQIAKKGEPFRGMQTWEAVVWDADAYPHRVVVDMVGPDTPDPIRFAMRLLTRAVRSLSAATALHKQTDTGADTAAAAA